MNNQILLDKFNLTDEMLFQLEEYYKILVEENKKAHLSETTPHCRIKCSACGANKLNGGKCDALNKNMVH